MSARLHAESERRVLWLTDGRREIAVSATGVHQRRKGVETAMAWDRIVQVQVTRVPLWPWRAWVDVFTLSGDQRVGPFPRDKAELWTAACGAAARDAGYATLALSAASGFALRPSG